MALQVALDRLTPSERVAFVLHEGFGVEQPRSPASWGRPRRRRWRHPNSLDWYRQVKQDLAALPEN